MTTGGPELLNDPVAQQLLSSTIPARLAYVWRDGTPRVASIWFHWNGAELVLCTFQGAPKLAALKSGDRVALTIDTNEVPNQVLSIRGPAEVTAVEGVPDEYAASAQRYLGQQYADGYISSLPPNVPMARIAVRPEHVTVLDFQTRFPVALHKLGLAGAER